MSFYVTSAIVHQRKLTEKYWQDQREERMKLKRKLKEGRSNLNFGDVVTIGVLTSVLASLVMTILVNVVIG